MCASVLATYQICFNVKLLSGASNLAETRFRLIKLVDSPNKIQR